MDINKRLDILEQFLNDIKEDINSLKAATNSLKVAASPNNYIEGVAVPQPIYDVVKKIDDYLDYEKIKKTMDALDWTVVTCDGPITVSFLRKSVVGLCVDCYDKLMNSKYSDTYTIATGGWHVQCSKLNDKDIYFQVFFAIDSVELSTDEVNG